MDSLAVYVHWPFCLSKCPYCDFNSHVREGVDHGRWKAVLLAEIDAEAPRAPGRTASSIFFGGGTRSEEHTSELQSLMRNSYAVFCLKKKNKRQNKHNINNITTTYNSEELRTD